jgi:hypothetical protein
MPHPDDQAIRRTLQQYVKGAISGKSADLRSAFHEDAMLHGYLGPEYTAMPIAGFYEWHDANGPASGLSADIANIDIEGTIATARVELDNWTGHRFTDMFTLLKVDGEWKIISKVFHLHA